MVDNEWFDVHEDEWKFDGEDPLAAAKGCFAAVILMALLIAVGFAAYYLG